MAALVDLLEVSGHKLVTRQFGNTSAPSLNCAHAIPAGGSNGDRGTA